MTFASVGGLVVSVLLLAYLVVRAALPGEVLR